MYFQPPSCHSAVQIGSGTLSLSYSLMKTLLRKTLKILLKISGGLSLLSDFVYMSIVQLTVHVYCFGYRVSSSVIDIIAKFSNVSCFSENYSLFNIQILCLSKAPNHITPVTKSSTMFSPLSPLSPLSSNSTGATPPWPLYLLMGCGISSSQLRELNLGQTEKA